MEEEPVPLIRRLLGGRIARDLCLGAREGSLADGPPLAAADDPGGRRAFEPLARPQAGSSRDVLPVVVVLLAVNASAGYLACFRYGAYDLEREPRHGEYLAYVQTTEDLVRALAVLDRAARGCPPDSR